MNNVITCVQVFGWTCIFNYLGYIGMELLDHMVTKCLIFWETTQNYFPKWLSNFPFPPGKNEVPISLRPILHLLLSIFFYYSHPKEVILSGPPNVLVQVKRVSFFHLVSPCGPYLGLQIKWIKLRIYILSWFSTDFILLTIRRSHVLIILMDIIHTCFYLQSQILC